MSSELPSETESKHQVIFLTEDEASKPSTVREAFKASEKI